MNDGFKLVVTENNFGQLGYVLVWLDTEDREYGAKIGERGLLHNPPTDVDDPEWDDKMATYLAGQDYTANYNTLCGFWWERKSEAARCLARIKNEWKIALSKRPWPEWAQTALREGWKPPKGWSP